jgi:hypothetical protein
MSAKASPLEQTQAEVASANGGTAAATRAPSARRATSSAPELSKPTARPVKSG